MPELGYEQKRKLIEGDLNPDDKFNVWVKDIYDDRVIIEDDGRLYEMSYSIDDNKVTLGDRKEVTVSYEALAEMKDIEVLKAGTFTSMNGDVVTYTEEDLEHIVKTNNELGDVIKPPLVATHKEGGNTSVAVFGHVDGGKFHNYRKVDDKILADLMGAPKSVPELLSEVEELRLSPEIYKDFKHEGRTYGKVLRRVAVVDIPAIKTMAGITEANLHEEKPDQPTTWIRLHEPGQSEKRKETETMPDEDVKKLEEKNKDLEEQNEASEKEKADLKAKLAEKEQAEKVLKVDAMIKPMRDAGLAPATADRLEKFAEELDSTEVQKFGENSHTALDEFGDILADMIERDKNDTLIVQFGELVPGSKGDEGGDAADKLEEMTTKKMKEKPDFTYTQAFAEVQEENPELAEEYIGDLAKKD